MQRGSVSSVFLSLALLAAVTGCSAQPAGGGSAAPASAASAGAAESDGSLRLLSNVGPNQYCGNSEGFYQVEMLDDHSIIHYWDYASNQNIILCAAPNCAHDSDACAAYLGGDFPFKLLATDDQLFVFAVDALYAANPDGSNRHVLADFSDGLGNCKGAAVDGGALYLLTEYSTPNGETVTTSTSILRVDLATGEVAETPLDGDGYFLDAADSGRLVLEQYTQSSVTMELFSIGDGSTEELYSCDAEADVSMLAAGPWLLVFTPGEGGGLDMAASNWADGSSYQLADCVEIHRPYSLAFANGRLLAYGFESEGLSDTKPAHLYAFDLAGQTVAEGGTVTGYPPRPYAVTPDDMLTTYIASGTVNPDSGVEIYDLARISFEDYLQGQPNYTFPAE